MGASDDVPQSFISQFVADCQKLLRCNPLDLIAVTFNESGCKTTAHNKSGNASGLWQFMPATAKGLGWDERDCVELRDENGKPTGLTAYGTSPLHRFRQLDHLGQWMWFRRFFRPHAGKLVSRAACYTCTFVPADLALAADENAVLIDDGRAPRNTPRRASFYAPNKGFDRRGDGRIIVSDLTDAINRAARGPRAEDLFARIQAEMAEAAVSAPPSIVDVALSGGLRKAIAEDVDDHEPDIKP